MKDAKKIADLKLYSFVLMPNHFHFIITPIQLLGTCGKAKFL